MSTNVRSTSARSTAGIPATSGYADLAREIRRLGLQRRRPGFYTIVLIANLMTLGGVVTAMAFLRDSWWVMLLAVALAIVSAQIGFFGHDAGHHQVARRRVPTRLLGLLNANLLNGLSYGWWIDKHNAHHAHPNDLEADPDVLPGILVFDAAQAAPRTGAAAWLTRHQAALFFPLLLLEALNLHVSSVRALLKPGIRGRTLELALLGVHFGGYTALLITTTTWLQAIVFLVIHQGLLGVYLGCSFAPNHKGMPTLTAAQTADPLLRQVLTSRNVRGGPFVDFVLGGLNYQIEHHLFPSMPRPNLRKAQPVVRSFCALHRVPYAEASAFTSYRTVIRHLRDVGADLRNARKIATR
ncbi:acyl-CoA desaturase [Kribbella sp. NPDC048915]|uniref:fatty acid desaturase family protein n=1 Tax=Kribbella sp. NPDC048915 TaxID=3155148 RepID=UPI0033EFDD42